MSTSPGSPGAHALPALATSLLPGAAELARRREELAQAALRSRERVGDLLAAQQRQSAELKEELQSLQRAGHSLDELEQRAAQPGLLASLSRQLGRRRAMLDRRSATEGLLQRYEAASARLRQAAAFCDELSLEAVALQAQLDALYDEHEAALRSERASEEQRARLDQQMASLSPSDGGRALDRLRFEEHNARLAAQLARSRAQLLGPQLAPTRALRDTLLDLRADLSRFVTAATITVEAAGRRIQALGLVADAPLVLSELQESLKDLAQAMSAAEAQAERARSLLSQALPALSGALELQAVADQADLRASLEALEEERARLLADQALREAAEREVQALGKRL